MGVGVHVGIAGGIKGLAAGVGVDPFGGDPMAGVTKDATSGKYTPASAAEWTKTMAAAGIASGGPSRLWLMQEASGNLADSIGTTTLTATGLTAYRQAVSGWTRLSVATGSNTSQIENNTDVTLPDVSIKSSLCLAYLAVVSSPAADAGVVLMGNASGIEALVTSSNIAAINVAAGSDVIGSSNLGTAVRPWALKSDVTNSRQSLYTNQDKVLATYAQASSAKAVFFGDGAIFAASMSILYATQFEGAAAELTDSQVKSLLQILGWTIGWS